MANVHPCQVECTLMAFAQTENVKIWSLLMVLQERVITAWSKLICFLPDELLYFIAGWHFKVIMALLTPDNFSCSVVLGYPLSFSLSLCLSLCFSLSLNGSQRRNKVMTRTERAIWGPPSSLQRPTFTSSLPAMHFTLTLHPNRNICQCVDDMCVGICFLPNAHRSECKCVCVYE